MFDPLQVVRMSRSVEVMNGQIAKSVGFIDRRAQTLVQLSYDIQSAIREGHYLSIYPNKQGKSTVHIQVIKNSENNHHFITTDYTISGMRQVDQLRPRLLLNQQLFDSLVRSPPKELPSIRPLRAFPPFPPHAPILPPLIPLPQRVGRRRGI